MRDGAGPVTPLWRPRRPASILRSVRTPPVGRGARRIALAVAGILLAARAATAQSPSTDQADAYLLQAEAAAAAGRAQSAASLVETALGLAPGDPECLYLRARLSFGDQARGRQVRDDLRAAVAATGWRRTDPDAASLALAAILVRTGALAEAEPVLRRLVRDRPENADALHLLGRLHARNAAAGPAAGRKASASQAEAVFADGAGRFPRDDRFPLGLSRVLATTGRTAASRAAVAAALRELPGSPGLLLRAAELETNADRRSRAVEAYRGAGGTDPLADLLALEAGARDAARQLALFVEHGGLSFSDLTDRAWRRAAGSKALAAEMRGALAGFTGARQLDADRDGSWEERWTIAAGSVTAWERDADQDGVAELSARFEAGQPVALALEMPGGRVVTAHYSRYPSLRATSEAAGPVVRTSILAPYSLGLAFLEKGSLPAAAPGLAPRPLRAVTLPAPAQLAAAAWRAEETLRDGGALVRRIDAAKGLPSYMEEDLDADGKLDHRVWYAAGSPVRGARDLDGDGIFESAETWKDGRLQQTAVDTDGDGAADYTELAGPEPVRLWDYDGDGRSDARQARRADGTVLREFSTGLDGRFDLQVVFSAERILSVARAGRTLAVRADAARGVVWIGAVSPGASIGQATPEGFHRVGSRRYLVFRHAGTTYAEELE